MTQSIFENPEVSTVGGAFSIQADEARQNLSTEFVLDAARAIKDGANKNNDKNVAPSSAADAIINGIAEALKKQSAENSSPSSDSHTDERSTIGESLQDLLGRENQTKPDRSGEVPDSRNNLKNLLERNPAVTDAQRASAKERLAHGLSDLIPEGDKAILKQMQAAIIDGDVAQLKSAFKQVADDPVKMEKFMKTLEKQMHNVEFTRDGAGNVLIYEGFGSNTAISLNPSTGETILRAVERQADGSVLLKPGEIINRTTSGVMKTIGDNATNQINWAERWNQRQEHHFLKEKNGGSSLKR